MRAKMRILNVAIEGFKSYELLEPIEFHPHVNVIGTSSYLLPPALGRPHPLIMPYESHVCVWVGVCGIVSGVRSFVWQSEPMAQASRTSLMV